MAHAIEVSNVNQLSSEHEFQVRRTNNTVEDNEFYQRFDEHEIELVQRNEQQNT